HDIGGTVVALDDLVRDPLDRTRDRRRIQRLPRFEIALHAHRILAAAQKRARLRTQPGPDIHISIVLPFPPSLWRGKACGLVSTGGDSPVKLARAADAPPRESVWL